MIREKFNPQIGKPCFYRHHAELDENTRHRNFDPQFQPINSRHFPATFLQRKQERTLPPPGIVGRQLIEDKEKNTVCCSNDRK